MPIIESSYIPPFWLRNGHGLSLWPVLFRPKLACAYQRQRIDTPDGDFLDLDLLYASNVGPAQRAVILTHGLEGNSQRAYMCGMARRLRQDGWDVIARHMRGCSGEMNRTRRITHMGDTDDLHTVVLHALSLGYERLVVAGFSMGGNQSLKYLVEDLERVPAAVQGCVVFSVPCDLMAAVEVLSRRSHRIYMEYFLRTLRKKMRHKAAHFTDFPDVSGVDKMRTFHEFDGHFTAPVHGFASAEDYWTRSSSAPLLHKLRVPTLLVNAADDPFLAPSCFPWAAARANAQLFLEVPRHGGHVGFVTPGADNVYWSEERAALFLREKVLA